MKKNLILFTIVAVFTGMMYASCNKITALINAAIIPWSGVDMSFNVPVITSTASNTSFGSGSFTYNLDSFIRSQTANQFGLANLDTFTLSTCTLTIQNPDADNNFANLESAQGTFYTSANTNMASIGSVEDNPDTYAATLSLPINNTSNLKSYVSSSGTTTFTYSLSAQARRVTTKELNVSAHVTFHIHVTP